MNELCLILAVIMLDYRQCNYTYCFITVPNRHFAKNILSITLKAGDKSAQPEELSKNDKI